MYKVEYHMTGVCWLLEAKSEGNQTSYPLELRSRSFENSSVSLESSVPTTRLANT